MEELVRVGTNQKNRISLFSSRFERIPITPRHAWLISIFPLSNTVFSSLLEEDWKLSSGRGWVRFPSQVNLNCHIFKSTAIKRPSSQAAPPPPPPPVSGARNKRPAPVRSHPIDPSKPRQPMWRSKDVRRRLQAPKAHSFLHRDREVQFSGKPNGNMTVRAAAVFPNRFDHQLGYNTEGDRPRMSLELFLFLIWLQCCQKGGGGHS